MTYYIHKSLLQKKIIHFDMDAFYAAVEMREDSSLKDKALIVGGDPESRSVVCTANYLARKKGVHSAMSSTYAKKLCPEAIFIKPRFELYRQISLQIREIFTRYTSVLEPVSLDEAYLDVSNNDKQLKAVRIAWDIQQAIYKELKLTGSAGVGPNKLLAKIASDLKKPFGIVVILPEKVREFMGQLPLRKIPGIGGVSEKKLKDHGLYLCKDVWTLTPKRASELGFSENYYNWLVERAQDYSI